MAILFFCFLFITSSFAQDFKKTISQLQQKIDQEYVKTSTEYWPDYLFPPISWKESAGLYKSYIHMNFHGAFPYPELRNHVKFPDNNGFVTMFINYFQLDSFQILGQSAPLPKSFPDSIRAVLNHKDKSQNNDSTIYVFWEQINNNGTWNSCPQNIAIPLEDVVSIGDLLHKLMSLIGLGGYWPEIAPIFDNPRSFLAAFQIPADTDDTGCGAALGGLISRSKDVFPSLYQKWASLNIDFSGTYQKHVKYSYQPFSNDINKNIIDPRTYYWIRGFLDEQFKKGNKGLSLINTWIMNLDEDRVTSKKGIEMPFSLNNVDVSVVSNSLFGMTSTLLLTLNSSSTPTWWNTQLQTLYLDSVNLLEWVLRTNAIQFRPDLMLLYYPPIYDFYWFVARLTFLLENAPSSLSGYPVLQQASRILSNAMRTYGTDQIIAASKSCDDNGVCWDGFIGNVDEPATYDDRLFSTSMAINTLLDTWTYRVNQKLKFLPNTPLKVQSILNASISWLNNQILSNNYAPQNSFFSGSMKSPVWTLPFSYPANYRQYLNGTLVFCDHQITQEDITLVSGMSGYMTPEEYEKELNTSCYGMKAPTSAYLGLNCDSCVFPYWSSPALTYASTLNVISKWISLSK